MSKVMFGSLHDCIENDMVEAAVDAAMSAYDDLGHDAEAWEDMVASVIQGHAMP